MPAERIYAHPAVRMDVGRVALKRGPLVYCVEEVDNPGGPVQRLKLPRKLGDRGRAARRSVRRHRRADRPTRRGSTDDDWEDTLYRTEPPAEAAGDD